MVIALWWVAVCWVGVKFGLDVYIWQQQNTLPLQIQRLQKSKKTPIKVSTPTKAEVVSFKAAIHPAQKDYIANSPIKSPRKPTVVTKTDLDPKLPIMIKPEKIAVDLALLNSNKEETARELTTLLDKLQFEAL